MATVYLEDFIDLGLDGRHDATSWQVALDINFNTIIDESLVDKVNLTKWKTPLPTINGDGFYSDLSALYARIKVHIEDTESPWFVLPTENQNYQQVTITQHGTEILLTDSTAINMR
jgi:hypothetical protein